MEPSGKKRNIHTAAGVRVSPPATAFCAHEMVTCERAPRSSGYSRITHTRKPFLATGGVTHAVSEVVAPHVADGSVPFGSFRILTM